MPYRTNLIYHYDGSYQGFLCCVAQCFQAKELPVDIRSQEDEQQSLFGRRDIPTRLDLAQRVEAFRKEPSPEGENIKGRKRTTLKLMIPNLTFSEPVDMGENVWIYMGDLCPAYCLYTPWEDSEAAE